MALIVQKFGGTSVADAGARACLAEKVRRARAEGDRTVLVVSAMGRRGAPYATDTLLDLLRSFDAEPEASTSDLIASCGEVISACVVSSFLRAQAIPSVPMTAYTAGIRAEGPAGDATPTGADAAAIRAKLERGQVPVICGFQAVGPDGQIVTLGRGGSDTSAVAVGIALAADYVDIYTDVPGVAKADPRVVPGAPFMDFLDYASMFRLAKHGARVLHDKSALLAERAGVKMRVRSTFDDGPGTFIGPEESAATSGRRAPDFLGLTASPEKKGLARVTAIFAKGRGTRGVAGAVEAAAAFGAALCPRDDPDSVSFLCLETEAEDLTRKLFATFA